MLMDMYKVVYLIDHIRKHVIVCCQHEIHDAAENAHRKELNPAATRVLVKLDYSESDEYAGASVLGVTDDGGKSYAGVYAICEAQQGIGVLVRWRRAGIAYTLTDLGSRQKASHN